MKNACAKFQRKAIISAELELMEILIVLNKRPGVW